MIDHVSYAVGNCKTSREFFRKALAPLGYELIHEYEGGGRGFGIGGKPEFWIFEGKVLRSRIHVAFRGTTRSDVDAIMFALAL